MHNVLLIVVDSMRSDRLHGERTALTPNIDRLVAGGTLFTTSVSPVAATMASVWSMFTGLFPTRTGMGGGRYQGAGAGPGGYVPLLKRHGYSTHATRTNLAELAGVTKKFDHYVMASKHNNYLSLHDGLGERLVDHIGSMDGSPWFFYIHLNDLHHPILVPPGLGDGHGDTDYDRMISYIDMWIGRIVGAADPERTLVGITSDHGEYVRFVPRGGGINLEGGAVERMLWRAGNHAPIALRPVTERVSAALHGIRSKMRESKIRGMDLSNLEERALTATRTVPGHHMFDDTLVTPLLFYGPGAEGGRLVERQVRNVDVFPTIVDLLGIGGLDGRDGISLVPMMRGGDADAGPAYIESMPTITRSRRFVGIRTPAFKYFRGEDGGDPVLFDLSADPGEERNIAGENPGAVGDMEGILRGILDHGAAGGGPEGGPGDDPGRERVEAELRKLGYV